MRQLVRRNQAFLIAAPCMLAALFVIGSFTGQWPWSYNSYCSYALQATSWLQGRLDLGQDYPWLELAIYQGRYYVSFPPFPSVVLLPFAAVMGWQTPDGWIALATALVGVWHACALCRELGQGLRSTLFWVLVLFLANGWLWIGVNGYVWFIAQNMCFTLCLMALYHGVRGRGCLSLAWWACAVGCRPTVILYLPLLLGILYRHERAAWPGLSPVRLVLRRWWWAIPTLCIAAGYMWLNWARFGNPLEFGHNYLPEFTRIQTGQFHLSYLLSNLSDLFRLPRVVQREAGSAVGMVSALSWYTINGGSLCLVNPILPVGLVCWLLSLRRRWREDRALLICLPILTVGYILLICCHRTLGGWHFGNRYLLETMPFLLYGMLRWMPDNRRLALVSLPYFGLGAMLNLVGTIALYADWI